MVESQDPFTREQVTALQELAVDTRPRDRDDHGRRVAVSAKRQPAPGNWIHIEAKAGSTGFVRYTDWTESSQHGQALFLDYDPEQETYRVSKSALIDDDEAVRAGDRFSTTETFALIARVRKTAARRFGE